jgi:hypothetical protein
LKSWAVSKPFGNPQAMKARQNLLVDDIQGREIPPEKKGRKNESVMFSSPPPPAGGTITIKNAQIYL